MSIRHSTVALTVRAVVVGAVLLASLSGFAAAASAATTSGVTPFTECVGGFGSGSSGDSTGRTYIACGSSVRIYADGGAFQRSIPLPFAVSDVAPSPDGSHLYVTRGKASPRRLNRQADGTYVVDAAWAAAPYSLWGTTFTPKGHWLATDDAGNVYLADGAWAGNNTHTVIKYSPSGRVVTRFGEWKNTWDTGSFYWQLNGLTVSRDGTRVYTVEGGNDRLQLWDRQADGTYKVVGTLGSNAANHGDREGDRCNYTGWTGEFASSYDAGLDAAGNIYVLNTTCTEVDKFNAAGAFVASFDLRNASSRLPHGFAVARDGDVFVPQAQRTIGVTSSSGTGDTTAPALGRVPTPRVVGPVGTAAVPLRFTWPAATDDVGVVRYQVQLRTDGGAFAAVALATPTSRSVQRSLTPGRRYQIAVRALDAAGNTSPWSSGPEVLLDAAQEKDARLGFSAGAWVQGYSPDLFGGGLRHTDKVGATMSYTFTGRQVAWLGPRNAGRGTSRVYIDGALVATVDQYSAATTSSHRRVLWTKHFPTAGTHTMKIVTLGTPGHPRVDVDAIVTLR